MHTPLVLILTVAAACAAAAVVPFHPLWPKFPVRVLWLLWLLQVTLSRPDLAAPWGVGVGMSSHEHHVVTVVTHGGIADAILLPGDIIFKVDGADAQTIDHDDFAELLSAATDLTLGVRRPEGGLDAESDEEEGDFGF